MPKAKENFGKIVEQQQDLMDKITANTNKIYEMFTLEETDTKEGRELINEFIKRNQQLMEEQFHPDNLEKFWEKMPEQYSKAMEMQMDFYNRTSDLMKRVTEKYAVQNQQNYWKKLSEVYMENYHAMMETSTNSFKAFQEFFNN
ncbi:MAG: hypothetical protein IPJ40_22960 [Saprospirales bacterium]|nr:hypothetical protein [Saprospirales bacterium]